MKLYDIIYEDAEVEKQTYNRWLRACREQFPNCTVTGSVRGGAQAVDWTKNNNEVAGDWKDGRGVVYAPGSKGSNVVDEITASDVVTEAAQLRTFAQRVARYLDKHFYVFDDNYGNDYIKYVIEETKAKYEIVVRGNSLEVMADVDSGASHARAREIKTTLAKLRNA